MTLKQARAALGWTQERLDLKAGLTRRTVADIEQGRNPNPTWKVVNGIMRALKQGGLKGLTAEDVFGSGRSNGGDG